MDEFDGQNPMMMNIGDIFKGKQSGYYEILSIYKSEEDDETWMVNAKQIATVDGRLINLKTPYECELASIRPAVTDVPKLKERIGHMQEFIHFLKRKMNGEI